MERGWKVALLLQAGIYSVVEPYESLVDSWVVDRR